MNFGMLTNELVEEVIDHERRRRASRATHIARNIEKIMNRYGNKKKLDSGTPSQQSGNKSNKKIAKKKAKKGKDGWWRGKVRLEDSVFVETDSEDESYNGVYLSKNSEMDSFVKNESNIREKMVANPFVKHTPAETRFYKPGSSKVTILFKNTQSVLTFRKKKPINVTISDLA